MRKAFLPWLMTAVCLLGLPSFTGADTTQGASRGLSGVTVTAGGADGARQPVTLYSGYHALVVGCGAYRNGWPPLPNPVKDAREVGAALKGMGWEVDILEDPDWEALRKALHQLVTGPGRDKERAVFFWYSGHGATLSEADGSRLGYIVPVDAPDPDKDEAGFMARAISMREVETVARRIASKHVLMAFDSCFSGAIFQLTRAKPPPFILDKASRPVRQFLTAGGEDERVPDRSVFKTVFIQGVDEGDADRNGDGYVTGQELGAYLQEKVVNYTRQGQHPQYGKINNPALDKGDFVFVTPKTAQAGSTVAAAVQGSAASPGAMRAAGVPSHSDIEAMLKAWNDAWNRLDIHAILSHYADDARIHTRVKSGVVTVSKNRYAKILASKIKNLDGSGFERTIFFPVKVSRRGNREEVRSISEIRVAARNRTSRLNDRFELIRKNDQWKIVSYDFEPAASSTP